ncbi:cilia- and flagella-associated protein 157-like [Prorops nasuta]|uniref:cilia- and flagella-associated protein 157-like n=1 Tax=Prorops nasuta TaxID=863751 RepID=UPI0034CDBE2F
MRGKEKKERKKKQIGPSEAEALTYEQQIGDYNKQLSRLRIRNEELENEVEATKQSLERLEEDRADIVAHLSRKLDEKIEQAGELSERLVALEEVRKEELARFKKKENDMESEYRLMENNLNAEVKLAAGKLSALEDWRLARQDLMEKFETREKEMRERESRHQERLYEAEKGIIIRKAKMEEEIEERLRKLAESFRDARNIRRSKATQRALIENIALHRELNTLIDVCRGFLVKLNDKKLEEHELRLENELRENEYRNILKKVTKQRNLIGKLIHDGIYLSTKYGELCRNEQRLRRNEKILQEYKEKCSSLEEKNVVLEQNIVKAKESKQRLIEQINSSSKQLKELEKILHDAKISIMEALKPIHGTTDVEDSCALCSIDYKRKMLQALLIILEKEEDIESFEWTD